MLRLTLSAFCLTKLMNLIFPTLEQWTTFGYIALLVVIYTPVVFSFASGSQQRWAIYNEFNKHHRLTNGLLPFSLSINNLF